MADAAEIPGQDGGADDGKIVSIHSGDTPLSLSKKAEGGLTLRFAFDLPKLPPVMAVNTWSHQQLINGGLIVVVALMAAFLVYQNKFAGAPASHEMSTGELRPNVATTFNPTVEQPSVGAGSYVDKLASVIGNVSLGKGVFVAPFASIRGDEGQPIVIGDGTNVQDGVVLHALETFEDGESVEKNLVTVDGKKYAVYVGKQVSLAHQSQVHGPAAVGDHTFVGMQALVFKAVVGKNVVIEPGAKVIGVTIEEGRYVPAGMVVTTQAAADALPKITATYAFATLNDGVLHVNEQFADKYLELTTGEKLAPAASGGHAAKPSTSGASGGHAPTEPTAEAHSAMPDGAKPGSSPAPKPASGH
jgi:carbonic anhydrase/acetyltransferase-like protein (isoleucine patch superfamily)